MDKNGIGNKAYNLQVLKDNTKFNIPKFYIIDNTNYHKIITGNFEEVYNNVIDFLNINNITRCSVRSSPIHSMPGTMDTILDVSVNELKETIYKIAKSYDNPTAKLYMKLKNIPNDYPGIIIQEMVYGNKNNNSGTGIVFTRNNTGKHEIFGEYIENGIGTELVSNEKQSVINHIIFDKFKNEFNELIDITEKIFKTPQEIEFTIEDNKLYILQTRTLQFNNLTFIKILFELLQTKVLTEIEFVDKLNLFLKNKQYEFINTSPINFINVLVASSGVVKKGNNNILIKEKLLNDDLHILNNYNGVITFEGSVTSHPAILCRNLNIPYIILDKKYESLLKNDFIIDAYNSKLIFDDITISTINEFTPVTEIKEILNLV